MINKYFTYNMYTIMYKIIIKKYFNILIASNLIISNVNTNKKELWNIIYGIILNFNCFELIISVQKYRSK